MKHGLSPSEREEILEQADSAWEVINLMSNQTELTEAQAKRYAGRIHRLKELFTEWCNSGKAERVAMLYVLEMADVPGGDKLVYYRGKSISGSTISNYREFTEDVIEEHGTEEDARRYRVEGEDVLKDLFGR